MLLNEVQAMEKQTQDQNENQKESTPDNKPPLSFIDLKKQSRCEVTDAVVSKNSEDDMLEESLTCKSSISGLNISDENYVSARSSADWSSTNENDNDNGEETESSNASNASTDSYFIPSSADPSPLPISQWAEPDSDSFAVRGKTYIRDKRKVRAGNSLFKLMTIDLIEVDKPILSGICSMPNERIQLALNREKRGDEGLPPFVFAVNIIVPGPPHFHLIIYFKVDKSQLDLIHNEGTPSSILANKFFFGDDDVFRDQTFKLIPRIVEGNYIVRKAVGSKPAIMGTKLKQYYHRCPNNRYFELILDVNSSKVAAHVVSLTKGYAKKLIVDLAFVLEGKTEKTLPEKVIGTCRLMHVRFTKARKIHLENAPKSNENIGSHKRCNSKTASTWSPQPVKNIRRSQSAEQSVN